jgi:hypothetical protein
VGVFLNWHFVNKPEVSVNLWGDRQIADAEGNLTDEAVRLFPGIICPKVLVSRLAFINRRGEK